MNSKKKSTISLVSTGRPRSFGGTLGYSAGACFVLRINLTSYIMLYRSWTHQQPIVKESGLCDLPPSKSPPLSILGMSRVPR